LLAKLNQPALKCPVLPLTDPAGEICDVDALVALPGLIHVQGRERIGDEREELDGRHAACRSSWYRAISTSIIARSLLFRDRSSASAISFIRSSFSRSTRRVV